MKIVLIACLCCFISCISVLLIAFAIEVLDGTEFMDAIAERIKGKK